MHNNYWHILLLRLVEIDVCLVMNVCSGDTCERFNIDLILRGKIYGSSQGFVPLEHIVIHCVTEKQSQLLLA